VTFDEELSAAARSLHREWRSPDLWTRIAAEMAVIERAERNARVARRRWRTAAAAAVLVIGLAASALLMRDGARPERPIAPASTPNQRLLSDAALSEVEQAEAQYIAAIEALATKAATVSDTSPSPVMANLRERLLAIDAAIAGCRSEIERNRFNAHLRRQLLTIYQEKRRTLEQILEQQEQHVS
jgi:hypothetical protein